MGSGWRLKVFGLTTAISVNDVTYEQAYDVYLKTLKDDKKVNISTQSDLESYHKWFDRINKLGKLNADYETFIRLFEENYKRIDVYDDVVNYIYSLKGKCNLCIFSDLIFCCFKALCEDINLDTFDYKFLSYKEHLKKGNIDAFKNVEEKLGVNPKDILFVDNNMENIDNAKKRKWNTCFANGYDPDKIKEAVEKFI